MKTFIKLLPVITAIIFGTACIHAKERTVTGTVTDEQNLPAAGVAVMVNKAGNGTMTGVDGKYSVKAKPGDLLTFVMPGYRSQQHRITEKTTVLNVNMQPGVLLLSDAVEVEYAASSSSLAGKVAGVSTRREHALAASVVMEAEHNMYYPGGEEYAYTKENRFVNVAKDPLSTFALEVDGASYSNIRRMINSGRMPDKEAVRVEEMINYFSYDYALPTGGDPLKISCETGQCPWDSDHRLVRIGIKAREIPSEKLPKANFVFLVDVSGSMYGRLELVKSSLKLLVNNLRDEDRIAIVAYAGAAGEVLSSTPGSDKQKIREALDNLEAGGSTAGGEGIRLAYAIARKNYIPGGNNRIIMATDGDFNVGVSSPEGLESLIETERKSSGVFLTVLGYGMGNYKDRRMQVLAEKGNGNHAYIDNMQEANKVLVGEFGGTMYAVAKDAKLQVEFNPSQVISFRLVGYESRILQHEDFNDDTKDAGEIGAGHSVTALYEIVPAGSHSGAGSIDPLKYQSKDLSATASGDLMTVKLRYKDPDGDKSKLMEVAVVDLGLKENSADFRFAASAAMFGQILRDSDFKGDATYDDVIRLAQTGLDNDKQGYRREMIRLAESAKGLTGK